MLSIKGEKAKFKAHIEDIEKCGRKTQKDFTHLIRPATSAGGFHDISGSSGSAGMISDDMTRPNSSWKKTKIIKPSEFLQQKQGRKQKGTFSFEKAEKIMKEVENTSKVLDNIDYMWNMVYKLTKEFIPQIKEMRSIEGRKLIKKIESFICIYQLTPIDFELFHYQAFPVFEWYVEGFEGKVKEIEAEFNELDAASSNITFINQQKGPPEEKKEEEEENEGDLVDHFNSSGNDMVNMSWNVS